MNEEIPIEIQVQLSEEAGKEAIVEEPQREEEIPQQKLTQDQIQAVYNDFKMALRNQNVERVEDILRQYKNQIDLVNRIDTQTRQISTYLGVCGPDEQLAFQILQMLCENGANIHFKDQMRQTILFYICRDGRVRLLDYLLQQGMNVNDPDTNGQTPVFYASRDNRLDVVKKLIEYSVDLNHVDGLQAQTCLFYAAREGHTELVRVLIENGSKPNHQDASKKTALQYAKKFNRKDVIDLITNFLTRMKDEVKKEESVQEVKQKKKREKEVPKQAYKLIYTDDRGNPRELTNEDFQKFQIQYPEVANLIVNADDLITEEMINQAKDDETWEKIARKIISQIWKSKGAYFFHTPVDPKKFGINDYFDIVKKPMDFGTIKVNIIKKYKNKLQTNVYRHCRDFFNDVMQVFENCILYNGTNSEVGSIGVAIKNEFQQLVDIWHLNKYL